MSSLRNVVTALSRWIDCVAATIVAAVGRLTFPRTVRIEEEESGAFAVRAGGQGAASGSPSLHVQIADERIVASNSQRNSQPCCEAVALSSSCVPRGSCSARSSSLAVRRNSSTGSCVRKSTGWTPCKFERRGIRLERANPVGQRAHPRDGRGHRARTRCAVPAGTQCARHPTIVVSTLAQDASGATVPIKVMDETARPVLNVAGVRRALAAVLVIAEPPKQRRRRPPRSLPAISARSRTSSRAGLRSGAPPSVRAEPEAK